MAAWIPAFWKSLLFHNVITVIPSGKRFTQEGGIPSGGTFSSTLEALQMLISALVFQISLDVVYSLDLLPTALSRLLLCGRLRSPRKRRSFEMNTEQQEKAANNGKGCCWGNRR